MDKSRPPILIVIDGPIGAGKTTVANLLHKKLRRTALLSLDRIKWLVSDFKPVPNDLQITSDVGRAMTREYFKKGINVIVEKSFGHGDFIKNFTRLSKSGGIKTYVYRITVDPQVAVKRVSMRDYPIDVVVKKRPSYKKIIKNHKGYMVHGYKKVTVFDSTTSSADVIARKILKDIRLSL